MASIRFPLPSLFFNWFLHQVLIKNNTTTSFFVRILVVILRPRI